MSVLLDGDTRVVVQGITNDQARRDTKYGREYGTNVVAGVRPGRGGETIAGVPVYDTVKGAIEREGAELCVGYVPPQMSKEAALEAFQAGIETYLMVSEEVPQQDVLQLIEAADRHDVTLIGPGSNGLTSAGEAKIGGHGGDEPTRVFQQGSVGIVSRSGGLATELAWLLKNQGIGVSTVVSIGGRPFVGSTLADVAREFETDDQTDVVVICGEAGTSQEETVAERLNSGALSLPVVALVGGEILTHLPTGISFGHTGAVIGSDFGSPDYKKTVLRDAGARLADTPDEVPVLVNRILEVQ